MDLTAIQTTLTGMVTDVNTVGVAVIAVTGALVAVRIVARVVRGA